MQFFERMATRSPLFSCNLSQNALARRRTRSSSAPKVMRRSLGISLSASRSGSAARFWQDAAEIHGRDSVSAVEIDVASGDLPLTIDLTDLIAVHAGGQQLGLGVLGREQGQVVEVTASESPEASNMMLVT